MPLRKYLSLGKRWVLERCNLLLKAVFSRLPIQNRVFFIPSALMGSCWKTANVFMMRWGMCKRWWWPGCFPTGAAQAENLLLSFDQPCDRHR